MLMIEQLRKRVMDLAHTRSHTLIAYGYPDRQSIDEDPKPTVSACLHPAKHHCAEHHIVTSGCSGDNHCPGQMAQGGHRYTKRARLNTQSLTQFEIHLAAVFDDLASVALHIGQSKREGRFIHILQHASKEGLMLFPAHSQAGLRNEVTERQGLAQLRGLALQNGLEFAQ